MQQNTVLGHDTKDVAPVKNVHSHQLPQLISIHQFL